MVFGIFSFFFRFFLLKLVYFWTENRKNMYGYFFRSICATELKFGAKNNVWTAQSILKTLIFANYWNHKWFNVVGIKISFEHVDSWAKFLHFLGPTIFKIPQPNWHYDTHYIRTLGWFKDCDFPLLYVMKVMKSSLFSGGGLGSKKTQITLLRNI